MKSRARKPLAEATRRAAQPSYQSEDACEADFSHHSSGAVPMSVHAVDVGHDDDTVGTSSGGNTEYIMRGGTAAPGDDATNKRNAKVTTNQAGVLWQRCLRLCCVASRHIFHPCVGLAGEKDRRASTPGGEGDNRGSLKTPQRLRRLRAGSVLRLLACFTAWLIVVMFLAMRGEEIVGMSQRNAMQVGFWGQPLLDCQCASKELIAEAEQLGSMLAESETTTTTLGGGGNNGHGVAQREPRRLVETLAAVKRWFHAMVFGSVRPTKVGCVERNPLSYTFLHREAVPWMTITAAAHRTKKEWSADPRGRESLLPFPVPSSAEERGRLWQELQADPTRIGPGGATEEISVAVSGKWGDFRSYLCDDPPNATPVAEYYLDPVRVSLLDHMNGGKQGRPAPSVCDGCAFHCVHPRLVRGSCAGRTGVESDASAESCDSGDAAISWAVSLEDVDAGLVHVPSGSGESVEVTRNDLFTCKLLNRKKGRDIGRRVNRYSQDPTNHHLLLSVDVWMTHFDNGLPLFFANDMRASQQGSADGGNVSIKRLLPVHTGFVHGESLQSIPFYSLQTTYWLQYDSVYLQSVVRRPDQVPLMPTASGERAPAPTRFGTWTMTSIQLRDFQLVVYFNQLRRRLLRGEEADAFIPLTARDAPAVLPWASVRAADRGSASRAMATGELARLGFELLHGANPMMLPMYGDDMRSPLQPVAWRPQTSAEWSGRAAVGKDARSPPRIRAIAVMISNCRHNRMRWLSELCRYYPVHNYGRCVIPKPTPLPGDAVPTPGIPQCAKMSIPFECGRGAIQKRHNDALESIRMANESLRRGKTTVHKMLHSAKDYGVRCVFRKYRYALPFENSFEDDYVTEKVYNALLSGALPLYIGAMNIADFVPSVLRRSGDEAEQFRGLSVVPVLQMFPLLNETAWRREANSVLESQERDEVMTRQVLRTHAAVLRAQASKIAQVVEGDGAAAKKYASTMASASAVASGLEMAVQASRHVSQHHYMLYTDATYSTETVLLRKKYGEPAEANATWADGALSSDSTSAERAFSNPAGTWPPLLAEAKANATDAADRAGHVADGDNIGAVVPLPDDPSAYFLGYGQCSYLQHVHSDARDAISDGAVPKSNYTGTREHLALRTSWLLTPNTARGFLKEVAESRARNATLAKTRRRAVEVFPELSGDDAIAKRRLRSMPRQVQGDAYSRHFNRVDVPPAAAYERELSATAVPGGAPPPPMNGFAQLAAYLRALDENPDLIDEAGYFDWWRAERMEDLGDAFLSALYRENPLCSICAAALEKKAAQKGGTATGPTHDRSAA
ncbi:Glycosyltransferase family 10 [Leishmania braziliensis]|nr:Glycosyltransferase family 10 [Leishmania braziliensis]